MQANLHDRGPIPSSQVRFCIVKCDWHYKGNKMIGYDIV